MLARSLQCVAQTTFYVPRPEASSTLAEASCYVARVVDARPQRASLGLVMRGSSPRLATFQESLPATLQRFFTEYMPSKPGATPLIMRLTGLEIAETPGSMGQTATAGLVADFYAPQPDSSYQLVAHFAEVHERTALDATGQHAANLGYLLLEAAKLGSAPAEWRPGGPRYPRATVLGMQPLAADVLPILAPAMRPQPGVYHSLVAFTHNQPDEPGQPIVELAAAGSDDTAIRVYHLVNGRRILADAIWGFCDGQDFYLRRGRRFCKLERQGESFFFAGYLSDDPVIRKATNSRAASSGAIIGGALGGAMVGAASAAMPSGQPASIKLNLLTGEVRLAQSSSVGATAVVNRPTHLFVYRPRDAKGPAVQIRLADDLPAQELATGDFLTFEPVSDQPVRVCLVPSSGSVSYLEITPTAEAPTYLECRPATPEPLRKVKDSIGSAALNKLLK